MRVWHVGGRGDHTVVDGINMGLWQLAAAQAESAEITLITWTPVTDASRRRAESAGFTVVHRPIDLRSSTKILDVVGAPEPDVVVLHGSWSPFHARAARHLRRRGVPYVLMPHGGHSPFLRTRSSWKRKPYFLLVERPLVMHAADVLYAIEDEVDDAVALYGRPPRSTTIVPFAVDVRPSWQPWAGEHARHVVFLGRFDVFQKGIDGVVGLAKALPDVCFHCYGSPPSAADAEAEFRDLARTAPANLEFREPVSGDAKDEVLRTAGLYLQYSRFEGFPLSVTEAMAAGVPVALADRLHMTARLVEVGAAAALDSDPAIGAGQLARLLDDNVRRRRLGELGRQFIEPRLDMAAIARQHLDIYERARSDRSPT